MEIRDITDIDLQTDEGKLLFMALARLSSTIDSHKTQNEIITILTNMHKEIYGQCTNKQYM